MDNKILFIGTEEYPIPAIKGGAVETLVTALINENETNDSFVIHVVSSSKDYIDTKQYKGTVFHYHKPSVFSFFKDVVYKLFRKLNITSSFYKTSFGNYAVKVANKVKPNFIVLETTSNIASHVCAKIKDKNVKILYHVHADYLKKTTYGIKKILGRTNYFVSVSNFIKKQLLTNLSIEDNMVKVLKNAVDIDGYDLSKKMLYRKEIRDKLNISDDDIVFVYCGRLSPEKGCLELIKAFNDTDEKGTLLIIGGSSFSCNDKNEYTEKLKLESAMNKKKILFTGAINKEDVFKYICSADVGVVPSICNEAASLSVLEFRAANLATIVSNVGGIPEYTNSTTSKFVDYDSDYILSLRISIDSLLKNKQTITELSSCSRNEILEFNYKNYFEHFLSLIKEIN